MTHRFTPRHVQTDVRLDFQISAEDDAKTSRGGDWRTEVTDIVTGQRYVVWGATCGIHSCFCDAIAIEIGDPE